MKRLGMLAVLAAFSLLGCRKKDDPVVATTGKLKVSIDNVAGTSPLSLDTTWYITEFGDSIKFTDYKYYISNIRLTTAEGTEFVEPESYHLINHRDPASQSFEISNVPFGNYTSITFMIGVDARRNTEGAQTGALDPIHSMFWDWNTGYIMAKLEAESPQSPNGNNKVFYHAGGFKGVNSVLRTVNLPFPQHAKVTATGRPNAHLKCDIMEWFKTPNLISVAELNLAMTPGPDLRKLADNYQDMFSVDHID